MELLRQMARAFPALFPDLHRLSDPDAELDFFNNIAHLQLHRRSRAFLRLKRVKSSLGKRIKTLKLPAMNHDMAIVVVSSTSFKKGGVDTCRLVRMALWVRARSWASQCHCCSRP